MRGRRIDSWWMAGLLALVMLGGACKKKMDLPEADVRPLLEALTDLDGKGVAATGLDEPFLLVFWRPGCSHCVAEMPLLETYRQQSNRQVFAVMVTGPADEAKQVVQDAKFAGHTLVDDQGALRKHFNIQAVPMLVAVNAQGVPINGHLGTLPVDGIGELFE